MASGNLLSDAALRQVQGMFRDFYSRYVFPVGARKRWHAGHGPQLTCIVVPQADVEQGEPMVCDVMEGPIGLETANGDTIIAINTGTLIEVDTRCEAVHYSYRKGGEPHPLTGPEVSSLLDIDSGALSSTTATQYADYELFSLEC